MSLAHIILGLLKATGSASGYDLKQNLDQSARHFWQSDLSQVYRALDFITKEGWTTVEDDPTNNRNRKIYTITSAGESAFFKWLSEEFEFSPPRRPDIARLFFGRFADQRRIEEQIINYRQRYELMLGQLQAVQAFLEQNRAHIHPLDATYWLITVDMGIRVAKTTIEWCNESIEKLKGTTE